MENNKVLKCAVLATCLILFAGLVLADQIVTRPDGCKYKAKMVDGSKNPNLEIIECSEGDPFIDESQEVIEENVNTDEFVIMTYENYLDMVEEIQEYRSLYHNCKY